MDCKTPKLKMSQTLFALERRFELRALYVFSVGLFGIIIAAIMHSDWWLIGICIAALFLNGLIGQGLQKNRRKSFSQLSAGSAGESQEPSEEPTSDDFYMVARSATKFMLLVVIAAGVIAYHFDQPWWFIIGAAVAAWAISGLLMLAAFWKARAT